MVTDLVVEAVSSLPHLASLAIGGTGIPVDLHVRFASTNIKHLTRLPSCSMNIHDFGEPDLGLTPQDLWYSWTPEDRFLKLRRFTVYLDKRDIPSADLIEQGEARGVAVDFKKLSEGWMNHFSS